MERASPRRVPAGASGGLFCLSLAALMLQVLLTRIFSVTLWYHFSFLVVSLALFGFTLGAVLVGLLPGTFAAERPLGSPAVHALLCAATIPLCLLAQLFLPWLASDPQAPGSSPRLLAALVFSYAVQAVPFFCCGIATCLLLTREVQRIGRRYAADLLGAALGPLLLLALLREVDALAAVLAVAATASLGAWLLARGARETRLARAGLSLLVVLGALAVAQGVLARAGSPLLRLRWVKGTSLAPPLYEKWSDSAYVSVSAEPPHADGKPFGWGMSARLPAQEPPRQLSLRIDASALTPLTEFHGDPGEVRFLEYDVVHLAHSVVQDARVLVLGAGGGRDLLAALVFHQAEVVGVEIHASVLDVLTRRFADFTGHLERQPRITLVHDEGRSYLRHTDRTFDLIQLSLVDTWAATAAGGFLLAESSLYTVEAWEEFLGHLTDRGILTVSRWYSASYDLEARRLVALATAALEHCGAPAPESHLFLASSVPTAGPGIATLLVRRTPFPVQELEALRERCAALGFGILQEPGGPTAGSAGSGPDPAVPAALDLAPPTDDRPFFFNMVRLRDLLDVPEALSLVPRQHQALAFFSFTLGLGVLLLLGCMALPFLGRRRAAPPAATPGQKALLVVYFAAIGLGYLLVEISQIHRLTLFLGTPSHAFALVLFCLLSGSSLGSLASRRLATQCTGLRAGLLLLMVALLAAHAAGSGRLLQGFAAASSATRLVVAGAPLLVLGIPLGLALPFGMQVAGRIAPALAPFLWSINAAASVAAGVLGAALTLTLGIAATFTLAVACDAVAAAAFLCLAARRRGG